MCEVFLFVYVNFNANFTLFIAHNVLRPAQNFAVIHLTLSDFEIPPEFNKKIEYGGRGKQFCQLSITTAT
jgi:hypothetical protein